MNDPHKRHVRRYSIDIKGTPCSKQTLGNGLDLTAFSAVTWDRQHLRHVRDATEDVEFRAVITPIETMSGARRNGRGPGQLLCVKG